MTSRYPDIQVPLVGNDGNAFAILAAMQRALRKGGVSAELVEQFHKDATSGDYNHLLVTCMEWVTVTSADDLFDDSDECEWQLYGDEDCNCIDCCDSRGYRTDTDEYDDEWGDET